MYLTIYDSNLTALGAVDVFDTVIWVRRDTEYSSFEITAPATENNLNLLVKYNIVQKDNDTEVGFINSIQITNDLEKGEAIKATGIFYCGVLKQRCVLTNATNLKSLIENNLRGLSLINVDSACSGITFNNDFTGENLGECITALAKANGFGFETVLNPLTRKIDFKIYYGTDRSIQQAVNPYVIFSDNYENLLESEYINSDTGVVNTVYAKCKLPAGIESCTPPTYGISAGTGTGIFEKYIEVDAVTYNITYNITNSDSGITIAIDTSNYFKVSPANGMFVNLSPGQYTSEDHTYTLASMETLGLNAAVEGQNRVDAVVIRLNEDNSLYGFIVVDKASTTNNDVVLAEITIESGTTEITWGMINNIYNSGSSEPEGNNLTITKTYLDTAATFAEMTAAAKAEIVPIQENFQGTVDFKLKYRTEYDLGDMVTIKNDKLGKVTSQRITEVTEVYDNTTNAITPTFGNPARTIMDILKKVK